MFIDKKYPWKVRRILKKKWKDIEYLFKHDNFKEKREKYIDGLIRKMTHEEALIYAYSDRNLKKEENDRMEKKVNVEQKKEKEIIFDPRKLFLIDGIMYDITKMEFLGRCVNNNLLEILFYDKDYDILFRRILYCYNNKWYYLNYGIFDNKNLLDFINRLISDNQEELAIKLYNRFVKKENDSIQTITV